jgi:hypothetical protein
MFTYDIQHEREVTISRIGGGVVLRAVVSDLAGLSESDLEHLCNELWTAAEEAREITAREQAADERAYRYAEWREAVGY